MQSAFRSHVSQLRWHWAEMLPRRHLHDSSPLSTVVSPNEFHGQQQWRTDVDGEVHINLLNAQFVERFRDVVGVVDDQDVNMAVHLGGAGDEFCRGARF